MIAAMFRAELPPEHYAYSKWDVVVTEHNRDVVDPADLAAWNVAAEDFLSLAPAVRVVTRRAAPHVTSRARLECCLRSASTGPIASSGRS